MERMIKTGGLIVSVIVLGIISGYLYMNDYKSYLIITATLTVIMVIVTVNYIFTNRSEESRYKSKINQILKTYDSVLVKSNNLPKLEDKNIIRVDSIEDLVDAQMEIRKPIYYQQQTESCSFVLLDNNEACIHIMKLNDSVTCPLEITLNEIEIKHKKDLQNAEKQDLSKIDSTSIVEVDDGKYIKVSPIRNEPVLTALNDATLPPLAAMGNEQVQAIEQPPVATANVTIPQITPQMQPTTVATNNVASSTDSAVDAVSQNTVVENVIPQMQQIATIPAVETKETSVGEGEVYTEESQVPETNTTQEEKNEEKGEEPVISEIVEEDKDKKETEDKENKDSKEDVELL